MTTREGNELVIQKENCVVEEIKEVELRSRRGKSIYNRTYNSIGLNQVSQLYFWRVVFKICINRSLQRNILVTSASKYCTFKTA